MKTATGASGQQRRASSGGEVATVCLHNREGREKRVGLGLDWYHFRIGKMTPQLLVVYIGHWKLLFHPATVPINFWSLSNCRDINGNGWKWGGENKSLKSGLVSFRPFYLYPFVNHKVPNFVLFTGFRYSAHIPNLSRSSPVNSAKQFWRHRMWPLSLICYRVRTCSFFILTLSKTFFTNRSPRKQFPYFDLSLWHQPYLCTRGAKRRQGE
jgi:hypothetical protein